MSSSPTVRRDIIKSNIDIILRLIKTEENLDKEEFMEQKGRTETLIESVDLLNEQMNNDYQVNEADKKVIESHNMGETAYRFRVSQSLVQLARGWNTGSSSPLTKAIEWLNLDHYVFRKLKCPVFNPESLERDKLA